jgi:hypothetical protein
MWGLIPTTLDETKYYEPQLKFIHNWVIMDIQWMVHWWVAGSLWPMQWTQKSQLLPNFVIRTYWSHLLISFSNHATTHKEFVVDITTTKCFTKPYKLQPHQTTHTHTHTFMEYTNAHKWSKATMPIIEHKVTNQVKSFDLGWSMHRIFTPYDQTCGVKKLCLDFF